MDALQLDVKNFGSSACLYGFIFCLSTLFDLLSRENDNFASCLSFFSCKMGIIMVSTSRLLYDCFEAWERNRFP